MAPRLPPGSRAPRPKGRDLFRAGLNVYYRALYRGRVPEAAPFGTLPATDPPARDTHLPVYGAENEFFRHTPPLHRYAPFCILIFTSRSRYRRLTEVNFSSQRSPTFYHRSFRFRFERNSLEFLPTRDRKEGEEVGGDDLLSEVRQFL